jgi:glutamate dehydrogenase/leucine dehydrogenase
MKLHRLASIDAFIAFDLDGARTSAGGTRFAPDVSENEAALLARAMTYKFGVIERPVAGAKGAIRGAESDRSELLGAYCEEIRPLVENFTFLTGPDLGTSESDFAPLRNPDNPPSIMASSIGGVPAEDLVTGFGVVAAAEAAMGSIESIPFAIEGFGKVGGGVAKEVVRRGGRVVGVSTLAGCVFDRGGLDVELLLSLRPEHGDDVIHHVGGTTSSDPGALFDVDAEVLVPGARTGVITPQVAQRLKTRWIAPAANVPYTKDAIDTMRARRICYLPDFVCNAGATIGYTFGADDVAGLFAGVDERIVKVMSEAGADPRGPFEGACAIAERFIETWRGPDGMPPGPPLA